ncbi:MAG: hypothetical protein IPK34_10285 [Ramlibacter sp.]|nr:hypothetical protein [Ramlibacter sp.]
MVVNLLRAIGAAVRLHPVVTALAVLVLARGLILAVLMFSLPVPLESALTGLLVNVLYYTAELVVLGFVLLWIWELPRAGRAIGILVAMIALPLILFLSILDPILYRVIGDRLSPSVLRQFAGWDLFVSDYFWAPVRAYWFAVLPGVLLLAGFLIGLGWFLMRHRRVQLRPRIASLDLGWTGRGLDERGRPATQALSAGAGGSALCTRTSAYGRRAIRAG